MTAPLSDARLAEITARLGRLHPCEGEDCRGDACKVLDSDAPDLLAEVERLREAHASLAAAFDGVRGERDQRAREAEETAEKLRAATRTVARLATTRVPGAECCAHCGNPRNGLGEIGGVKVCHTGTNPAQFDPIDCYRLVTVYREPLGARIGESAAADDANAGVYPDCYGRGDDFEGGTCGRCAGTGGAR